MSALLRLARVCWPPTAADWWETGRWVRHTGEVEGWDRNQRREFQNDALIALTARPAGLRPAQLTIAATLTLFAGENVPDARIWGFELEGSQIWDQGVNTGIGYSYTDSRDLDSGRVLPHRPYHQGRAYCEWQLSAVPLTLGSELVYRGSHFDDSNQRFRAGDAVYLNAQASYRISPALQAYLRGENLTDDRTPGIFSFRRPRRGGLRRSAPGSMIFILLAREPCREPE